MKYYAHHLGDYLQDTAHLSMIEDGAYRRLLDAYYIREAPLPMGQEFRLGRAQSRAEKLAVTTVLGEFFYLTDDGWRHRRCDAEIERINTKSDKAKESAEARWKGTKRNANAMRTHSDGNATPILQDPITKIPNLYSSESSLRTSSSDRGQDVLKNGEEKRQAVAALVKGFGS